MSFIDASSVSITKKSLGSGAYGRVWLAKLGQLPCAVKLLHDSFFDSNDPGSSVVARKFDEECELLNRIKHPNVVQYLGIFRDPESRRPVLLMEVMDESLTDFLKRKSNPLPYHTQLDICYDTALALSYLHSIRIVHRDLSSNNVLLFSNGARAKVTDFGMSKLVDANPRMTPLTQVPGTPAYMPPEALIVPPKYSSKLDCFSHGVLTIQVITRKFPNPGDAHREIVNRIFPTGKGLVQIPELERRKKHIDLIEHTHSLLAVLLASIKDEDIKRLSANEICKRLESLKSGLKYKQSAEQDRLCLELLKNDIARCHVEHKAKLQKREEMISFLQAEMERKANEFCVKIQQQKIELEERISGLQTEMEKMEKALKEHRIIHEKNTMSALPHAQDYKWSAAMDAGPVVRKDAAQFDFRAKDAAQTQKMLEFFRKRKEHDAQEAEDNYLDTDAGSEAVTNMEEFECPVCFSPTPPGDGFILRGCLHKFCKECLHGMIMYCAGPDVKCCFDNGEYICGSTISEREIKAVCTKEELLTLYQQCLVQAENAVANSFHCRTANCVGFCFYEDEVNEFHCPVCHVRNCLLCKAIHEGMNCQEYQDDLKRRTANDEAAKATERKLQELIEKGEVMHCPQCNIVIEKRYGSDWLRCAMCKTEICWATKMRRWGPQGRGDKTGGCHCREGGKKCHPLCRNCH